MDTSQRVSHYAFLNSPVCNSFGSKFNNFIIVGIPRSKVLRL